MTATPQTMWDSTTAADIPQAVPIVAGYIDGNYAWSAADWARFPGAVKVTITVTGLPGAKVADVEWSDLDPVSGARWASLEVRAGRRPTLYCNTSAVGALRLALAPYSLTLGTDVDWWAADWTGAVHEVAGAAATQYADPPSSGGHYDLSVTNGVWPGTMAPVPAHPATVAIVSQPGSDTGYWIVAADGGVFTYGGAQFYGSMGGKPITAPIVAADATSDGKGYRLVGADGAVYDFGAAVYEGGTN